MLRAICAMAVLLAVSASAYAEAAKQGDVILAANFEEPGELEAWGGRAGITLDAGCESAKALCVTVAADSKESVTVGRTLPVERIRGCKLLLSAMVKAEGVSARPQPWNGVKFMMPMTAGGNKLWPQGSVDVGTFGWRRIVWQTYVPDDATQAALVLGLENVTGRVWFDDIKITVRRVLPPLTPRAAEGPAYKGHPLPRLRGAMISPNIDEDGLRTLGRVWNANLIRWQLIHTGRATPIKTPADYDAWLEGELKKLDAAIPLCEKYGIYVVLDLHSPPGGKRTAGGYSGSDDRLFTDKACQDKFVEVWQRMAKRYRGAKVIWGYDLANEPVEDAFAEGCDDWQGLAERAAKAIRAIDPERTIIVEPANWGGPAGMSQLRPIDVPNVVYSVHMYNPGSFTHQGVFGEWTKKVSYPGETEGKMWDKAALEASLKPAVDFQKAFGVHIYVGEFSAIRWAPDGSAARYLKDCIDIFESHGWDWSYHAFREWSGWSVEHGPDKADTKPAAQQTDREKLLREWYAKNQKTAFAPAPAAGQR
jgi:endoglucanase